jgi:hypothetical protein
MSGDRKLMKTVVPLLLLQINAVAGKQCFKEHKGGINKMKLFVKQKK